MNFTEMIVNIIGIVYLIVFVWYYGILFVKNWRILI
jgi:hypothetical protein